jgi:hypothetical protein
MRSLSAGIALPTDDVDRLVGSIAPHRETISQPLDRRPAWIKWNRRILRPLALSAMKASTTSSPNRTGSIAHEGFWLWEFCFGIDAGC